MKKILIIEDEQALQKTLGDVLREAGFETVSALDGEIGLRLAKETKPDLMLLDLILPKLNGFEVLEALKKDTATKSIPVIILTNLEEMQHIQEALDLGATTYLVKASYTLKELVEKVKQSLS